MVRPGEPMKGRKFHASCASREKDYPPSQLNRTARAVVVAPGHSSQQVEQPPICHNPRKGNGKDMRQQHHTVAEDRVCRSKRRRIVENEERDRAERA